MILGMKVREADHFAYRYDLKYPSRRSPIFARNVVTSSQPLATQAGLAMFPKGGNAIDAALAAAIALVVVEPTGNGLGSDAFCIIWDGSTLHGLNASGRSPKAWKPSRFAGYNRMPYRGWESVTVPGAVAAWADLSARFGRLPFPQLFEPAVQYAEAGFHVSPIIAELWRRGADELRDQPGFAGMFMPNGRSPAPGEIFSSRTLAKSLQLIAETKGKALYEGILSEHIINFAKQHGAALSADDLAQHRNEWCGTISQEFHGISLHEIPPNTQGIAACMALGIVGQLGIAEFDSDSADAIHLQIEAMKLAFADLDAYVADVKFMTNATPADLLCPDYLARRAQLINRQRAQAFGAGAPRDGGTVCLATADETGMMVSYIQSNFAGFGSGVVVPDTGISLQNRGAGFCLNRGHPNEVGSSKQPFHTIIPGFITRGPEPLMAFGLMGGLMQAQGHLQMVLRTQTWGQDPQTAADAPRWRIMGGLDVALEATMEKTTVAELAARGHNVICEPSEMGFNFGGAQLVHRIGGGYVAGSDFRKDGCAAGI